MSFSDNDFKEDAEDVSNSHAGAAPQEGRATYSYILQPNNLTGADLVDLFTYIFGTTNTSPSGDGRLNRDMPLAHPVYPNWYAHGLAKIIGVGVGKKQAANPSPLDAINNPNSQLPFFSLYPQYRLVIDFGPTNYNVLPDDAIYTSVYTRQTWNPPLSNTGVLYFWASEWTRFVDWTTDALPDFIKATGGQTQIIFGPAKNVLGFPGTPNIFLQNQLIKMTWRQVPYRFITSPNSYIQKAIGRINQNSFFIWLPGQLLYLNYKCKPYTPPVGQIVKQFLLNNAPTDTVAYLPQIQNVGQLVDIEFTFMLTTRTLASGDDPKTYINNLGGTWYNNWIYKQGHNLLPYYFDRLFHYVGCAVKVGGVVSPSAGRPSFFSFPFELLFTDPDTTGNTAFI
jgi:hypothetical protein